MSDILTSLDARVSESARRPSECAQIVSRAGAIASGAKRYFTGKPCPRGHVAERYTSKCICVVCNDSAAKEWGRQNPCGRSAIKAKWRNSNINRAHATEAAWRARNVEHIRQKTAKRAAENRDEILATAKAYRAANKEACRARVKDWFQRNPNKARLYNATRRGLLRSAEGTFTTEDLAEIRKRQRDRCAYCRAKLEGAGHLDHITAVSKGGSNWPRNLQWLCATCNVSKHDKDAIDFAQTRGLLL